MTQELNEYCPCCFSSNLALGDPVDTAAGREIEVFCRTCGEEWVELE